MNLFYQVYNKDSFYDFFIPTTNLNNYFRKEYIELMYSKFFPSYTLEESKIIFKERLDVIECYKKHKNIPNIYYLQNNHDFTAGHIVTQYGEFIYRLTQLMTELPITRKSKIITETFDREHLKGGHFPISKVKTIAFMKKAFKLFKTV